MKKYLPALVAGFGAGVLHVVPLTKAFTCCLVIPAAAVVAILLDQKANNKIGDVELKHGVILGLVTGLFAALFGSFFDLFITLVTKNNDLLLAFNELTQAINQLPFPDDVKEEVIELMKSVATSIRETGFSPIYMFSVLFNNFLIDSIFGVIGGLVGTKVINSRNAKSS